MSTLPKWLWPVEDEEAVQEAERLIVETQQALEKLDSDLKVQKKSDSLHSFQRMQRLKGTVNSKIQMLEEELKTISQPPESSGAVSTHKAVDQNIPNPSLNAPINKSYRPSLPIYLTASTKSQRIPPSQQIISAENVIQHAHDKVQGALRTARYLSASLSTLEPNSLLKSKTKKSDESSVTMHNVTTRSRKTDLEQPNVKVVHIKSRSKKQEEVTHRQRPRLEKAMLPSISIKRGLEFRKIPPVQITPTDSTLLPDLSQKVVMHHVHYDQQDEKIRNKNRQFNGDLQKSKNRVSSNVRVQDDDVLSPTNTSEELKEAVSQLRKQIAETEELRELNQTQVNHVLKFLLSRVCRSESGSPDQSCGSKETLYRKKKTMSFDVPATNFSCSSTNGSEKGESRIAYDSLSRFLETYRQAAESSMRAAQRKALSRKKSAVGQQEKIEIARGEISQPFLIGSLRTVEKEQSDLNETDKITKEELNRTFTVGVDNTAGANETKSFIEDLKSFIGNESLMVFCDDLQNLNLSERNGQDILSNSFSSGPDPGEHDSSKSGSGVSSKHSSFNEESLTPNGSDHYEDDWEEEVVDSASGASRKSDFDIVQNVALPKPLELPKDPPLDLIPTKDKELSSQRHVVASPNKSYAKEYNLETGEKSNKEEEDERLTAKTLVDDTNSHVESHKRVLTEKGIQCDSTTDGNTSEPIPGCSQSVTTQTKKSWDLSVQGDIQLRSNFLCPDERREIGLHGLNRLNPPFESSSQQTDAIKEIEQRWRKSLADLELRLQMVENQEKVSELMGDKRKMDEERVMLEVVEEQNRILRLAEESRQQSLTEQKQIEYVLKEHKNIALALQEQMIQTTREQERQQQEWLSKIIEEQKLVKEMIEEQNKTVAALKMPEKDGHQESNILNQAPDNQNPWLPSFPRKLDLTDDLLMYGRMGTLMKLGSYDDHRSSSLSSSGSSIPLQSSLLASLSEGEMRASGSSSSSCACSEGEICFCASSKNHKIRLPPDGSHQDEQLFGDLSQGEVVECNEQMRKMGEEPFQEGNLLGTLLAADATLTESELSSCSETDWIRHMDSNSQLELLSKLRL